MVRGRVEPLPLGSPAALAVFTTVLTEGPLSRVEIGRRTGLSSATVTKAVRPLLDSGHLVEDGDESADRGIGRPANPLRVRADRDFFLGVKVTGDDLIGTVTDLRARIRRTRHLSLPSHQVEDVVAAIAKLVGTLLAGTRELRTPARQLAVSVAGDVDRPVGLVRYSPFLDWRDVPLAQLVGMATGLRTVVENDVRALTVAEHWFGAGVGASCFALVTVGAGIGCGIVVNDVVLAGAHGVAGEIGHLPIETGGPRCRCGNSGCVEAIASDHAIIEQFCMLTGATGVSIDEVSALAHDGDAAARAVYARAGHAIGLAIASVANLLGPERIVISGEGLAAYDLFEDQVRATFRAQAFGAAAECDLIVCPLSFEEWARGAAAVAIQDLIMTNGK